jgi:hypothetical protein
MNQSKEQPPYIKHLLRCQLTGHKEGIKKDLNWKYYIICERCSKVLFELLKK